MTTKVLNFLMSTSISKTCSILKISAFLFLYICMKISFYFQFTENIKRLCFEKIGMQDKRKTVYTGNDGQNLKQTKEVW